MKHDLEDLRREEQLLERHLHIVRRRIQVEELRKSLYAIIDDSVDSVVEDDEWLELEPMERVMYTLTAAHMLHGEGGME